MSTEERSSLALELIELAHALESVRLVTECGSARAFPVLADVQKLPQLVSATVGLVVDRLHSLGARLSDEAGGHDPPASAAGRRAPRAARRA